MDVHEYLGVLRRGVLLIVLGVVAGLLGGGFVQSMDGPSYSATSRDLVTNTTSGDLTEWLQASNFTESRIASYVLVASSGLVLQPVIDDLGLDATVEDLSRRISVTAPPATFIIEITATAATPEEARDIANAVSAEFGDVVANQLETTATEPTPGPTPAAGATTAATPSPSTTKLPNGTVVPIAEPITPVRIVNIEEAVLPTEPLPTNSGLILIVGGVLGLTAGLIAASLREVLDTRVRGPKDVAAIARIPVIGEIPGDRTVKTSPLVAQPGSGTRIAEAFRSLRANLDHQRTRDGRRGFVITAAAHGQGATTITANLAVAVAGTATSVVVVDADLRSSALSRLFGIHGALGLTEVLSGRTTLDAALRPGASHGVTVLPAGARPANPGELLASAGMRELLAELRRRFDVVLIDAPPISSVTDAAVLGALDCATMLVLAPGTTTRPKLEDALAQLAAGGSTASGVVLNGLPRRASRRRPVPAEPAGTVYAPAPLAFAPVPRVESAAEPVSPLVPQPVSETPAAVGPASAAPEAEPALIPAQREPVQKAPSHLAPPLTSAAPVVPGPAATARATPRTAPRRVSAPAAAPPHEETAPKPAPAPKAEPIPPHEETAPKPAPAPKAEPIAPARLAAASAPVTEIEHTIGTARQLDYAFAALPAAPDIEDSEPTFLKPSLHAGQVELPIVVKPDPVRASRFAPGPVRGPVRDGAYANAPAPRPGTQGRVPPAAVEGTVVETVSVRVKRDEIERPAAPPPIRHILPRPTASTIPPKEVEAARPSPEPEPVEVRPRTRPVPVPPLARELDDDPTAETPPPAEAETRAIPVAGSLLGEIGGLPRVEVRAARPTPVTDTAPNPERTAREAYELRARELERVAHERLMREQQRLAVDIREQLAHDKRELESVLDNRLEDTVLHPRA